MERHAAVETYSFLRELIYRHSGIALSDKETGMLRARLARRWRDLGLASEEAYLALLTGPAGEEEIPALLDVVTVNYTFFFREQCQFEFLGAEVLPRIFAAKMRAGSRKIRAWSAGCSTGEEPYSIAMTFAEAAGRFDGWDFRVLATDINRRVLRTGARGVYPLSKLSGVPQEYFYKYLTRGAGTPEDCLNLCPELRAAIAFRRLNILREAASFQGLFDFIFCRNVMIYFDGPTREGLLRNLYRYLAPGGYLFVGSSESTDAIPPRFHPVFQAVYRKP